MMDQNVRIVVKDERNYGNVCSRPRKNNGMLVRCWSRDFAACPSCADLNLLYTKKLIGAGFENNEGSKFYFLTLTAPSFGKVHTVPHSASDKLRTCSCGAVHEYGSGLAGVPIDGERYRYRDAVVWNRNSSELFRRSMKYLNDSLDDFAWCSVREYQRRGSLHYHVIVRADNDYSAVDVVKLLSKVGQYRYKSFAWGRSVDVRVLSSRDEANGTVRYMSKVVGYAVKTLGKSIDGLSAEQKSFYKRLDQASAVEGYKPKVIAGFGYGGQLFTKSDSWSDLTKADLVAEARAYAANSSHDDAPRMSASVDVNAEELRELAKGLGNGEDYTPPQSYVDALRARVGVRASTSVDWAAPAEPVVSDAELAALDDVVF